MIREHSGFLPEHRVDTYVTAACQRSAEKELGLGTVGRLPEPGEPGVLGARGGVLGA